MRTLVLATVAATALALGSTAANATITLGANGTTAGTQSTVVTDNVNIPNKLEFDTTNVPSGSVTSFFDFSESYASQGIFVVGAATIPNSTVTLVELLTGSPLTLVSSAGPSPNSLTFTTGNLTAGQTYRFRYTVNMGSPGNISGNATFYQAVPEPATWALMLLGFGGMGMAMRRRRRPALAQLA
jgi:hypothetical protein